MNLGESNPALRVIPARIFAASGLPLSLATVFATGDLKIVRSDLALINAANPPVAVAAAAPGSFNITLNQEETMSLGAIRLQLTKAGIVTPWEWLEPIVRYTPVVYLGLIEARLFDVGGNPLSLSTTFATGDLKLVKPDGTVVNANHLPVPISTAQVGSFSITIDSSEVTQTGIYRLQLAKVGVITFWEWADSLTTDLYWTPIPHSASAVWTPA